MYGLTDAHTNKNQHMHPYILSNFHEKFHDGSSKTLRDLQQTNASTDQRTDKRKSKYPLCQGGKKNPEGHNLGVKYFLLQIANNNILDSLNFLRDISQFERVMQPYWPVIKNIGFIQHMTYKCIWYFVPVHLQFFKYAF